MTAKFYQKIIDREGLPVYWGQYVYRLTRLPLGNPWPSLGGYAIKRCRRGLEDVRYIWGLDGHVWTTTAWKVWNGNAWCKWQ